MNASKRLVILLFLTICVSLFARNANAEKAAATLKGTSPDSEIYGTVSLTESNGFLSITANVKNVLPGQHGLHIHEFGACTNGGKDAGGHFNPDGVEHGDLAIEGFEHAHAGDLGNITVGPDGTGQLKKTIPGLSISSGKYAVAGRAFILHERADDFGQPTGNAGGRIACGSIYIAKDETT